MWIVYLFQILLSLIIIFLFHKLYEYLKNNFTKKIKKDVFSFEINKYKEIIEELSKKKEHQKIDEQFVIFEENKDKIENELVEYIKDIS
jgi:uncharacterized membrane protein YhiD involved in acid resistance